MAKAREVQSVPHLRKLTKRVLRNCWDCKRFQAVAWFTQIYSHNRRTFIATANWLKKVRKDERLNTFLSTHEITWQFNLSRAPWWGGQFERLIGVMKGAFYKTVGQGQLSWDELSEVLLDVEIVLNNRPLSYAEDDIQLPTLTPNALLFIKSNILPELQSYHLKEKDLRKRAKFLQRSKDAIWRRQSSEYQRALLERHRLKYGNSKNPLSVGDVLILKSEERNRNCWPLGIIEKLIAGHDGVLRAAKVRTQKTVLERAIQHLYPLELSCDRSNDATPLNPTAPLFRSRQDAAAAAKLRILDIANDDQWTLNLRHSYRLNVEPNISFVALFDQCRLVLF